MAQRTFRDVLGEPSTWLHSVTSTRRRPDLRDATIKKVFCSGSRVSLYTQSTQYGDTVSVFNIPEREIRERVLDALRTGSSVSKFLGTPV
jgi:hypothetical protein